MFKFITNYFEDKKENDKLEKIKKETHGLERLTRYIRKLEKARLSDLGICIDDIIDTLEDHEKRIKHLEGGEK